jgi:hypothetical protein
MASLVGQKMLRTRIFLNFRTCRTSPSNANPNMITEEQSIKMQVNFITSEPSTT